jgi:hypothetical protein
MLGMVRRVPKGEKKAGSDQSFVSQKLCYLIRPQTPWNARAAPPSSY